MAWTLEDLFVNVVELVLVPKGESLCYFSS
jgi:hypothetical protein